MVPEGWEKSNLEDLLTIKHGFAFKSQFFSNEGD
jgi:type I restriction enzyme S subunit